MSLSGLLVVGELVWCAGIDRRALFDRPGGWSGAGSREQAKQLGCLLSSRVGAGWPQSGSNSNNSKSNSNSTTTTTALQEQARKCC